MKRFSYSRDGHDFGPTDLGGLRPLAKSLHLRPDCRVHELGVSGTVSASTIEGLVFPDLGNSSDDGPRKTVVMDLAYLAQQRRVILRVLLGGAAFLAALLVMTLFLGTVI